MADEQDKKLKAEKSLNHRLMKQLNTSLVKANDVQKERNKSDSSLHKNISKLNTNIANINKLLSSSKLPKSLDNLNDKVKTFTKAFDARVIPNKLNRLSKNITNLNRLLETEVLKGFENVSKKANSKRSSKSASAGSSFGGAVTTPGKGFKFAEMNTIYNTRGPAGLLGSGRGGALSTVPSYGVDEGLNTVYADDPLQIGAPGAANNAKRKARQPRGSAMAVSTMLVKKAFFESAVFKNAIFKGTKGGRGGSEGSFGGSFGARPEVEQKFQRLFPDIVSIVKGQRKTQQQFLKQTPQQLFREMRRSGIAPAEARRAATRQARTRNVGSSIESGLDVAKEQLMSGLTDFGVPDSFEAQMFRGIRGIKNSFKARKQGLLDPEQTQATTGTFGKPSRFSKPADLIRTDDKLEKKRDDVRNTLLSKILKALGGAKGDTSGKGGLLSSLFGGLLSKGGGLLKGVPGLLAGAGSSIMSGLGSVGGAIGSAGSAVASGAGSLFAAGGTAVGSAGAATVGGVVAAAGAIGAGIGLTVNEIMEKKFPEAEKAVSGFFGGVVRFFDSDLDNIMKNNESSSKKLLDQNLILFGEESVRLEKEADKLKQEAKSARNQIFGLIGGDEEEAKKLEAKEKILRSQASLAGRRFVLENKTVTPEAAAPLIKQSVIAPTSDTLSRVEIETNNTRKTDKEKFAEFLLGEFIDTLVSKLNVGGGDQQIPNNSIRINPNG